MDRRQICWAHLIRKFVAFTESPRPEVKRLGEALLEGSGVGPTPGRRSGGRRVTGAVVPRLARPAVETPESRSSRAPCARNVPAMTSETPKNPTLPAVAVRLAALWVLVGAGFKLFLGTPADLPQVIRDLPLELGLTYKLAISIELFIALLAVVRPRLGWIPIALLYLVFEGVLAIQLANGETSCGCLGSTVQLTPAMMMGIDTALLALLLLSKPWRLVRGHSIVVLGGTVYKVTTTTNWRLVRGHSIVVLLIACLTGVALPWLFDREAKPPPKVVPPTAGEPGVTAPSAPPTPAKRALREYVVLSPEDWIGESVYDTPLGDWVQVERADPAQPAGDISELPTDGAWILWRWDCDHCAEHLEYLANFPPSAPFLTLIRLHQTTDSAENQAVHQMPEGPTVVHASMPDSVVYVTTTPCELVLEGATIAAARESATLENSVIK
jgi:hypothetical protein